MNADPLPGAPSADTATPTPVPAPAAAPASAAGPAPSAAPALPRASDEPIDMLPNEQTGDEVTEYHGLDDEGPPITGVLRAGVYTDSDHTLVLRGLGAVSRSWEHWTLRGSLGVDSVSSASVDVRSSPALSKVDVVTSASRGTSTSGGEMTDTRVEFTGSAGWKGNAGSAVNLTTAAATETDYQSLSGGLNGSFDLLDRQLTLLGGASLTDNWVSSVLDTNLHEKMFSGAWSAGFALVSTRTDVFRLHYDGKASNGYLASPYRSVRFGDWTASSGAHQIMFIGTLGSADGLPERVPDSRVGHALVVEWLHSLAPGLGLHPELRVSRDNWQIESLTAGFDLRFAADTWRLQVGYRLYLQQHASFFHDKYTKDSSSYRYYTSDKELGDETGHLLQLDLAFVLGEPRRPNDTRTLLNLQLEGAHYQYQGFFLLPSRDSLFATLGISWEL